MDLKEFCISTYNKNFEKKYNESFSLLEKKNSNLSEEKINKLELEVQKEAIKLTTIDAIKNYPSENVALIWKYIYESHIKKKSGISDTETISKVISADQSWKKSSGHAFEEMIKYLGNLSLEGTGIEILLQRDLNLLIKSKELANEPRDISWLKEQIKSSVFDLYAIVTTDEGKKYCFGCIQSKTSIRDRVTRDREPSIQAMESFFWSTIIVLDGDFLKLPKFKNMVNGGTSEYPVNGWHGMYVFSDKYTEGRIYPTNIDFTNFSNHAQQAAKYWLSQRQWFNKEWIIK